MELDQWHELCRERIAANLFGAALRSVPPQVAGVTKATGAMLAMSCATVSTGEVRVKRMSVGDALFASIRMAPVSVDLARYCFKMSRVDTGGVPAEMVNVQTAGDRADCQRIGENVGASCSLLTPELAISRWPLGPSPQPAPTQIGTMRWRRPKPINLRPESFFDCSSDILGGHLFLDLSDVAPGVFFPPPGFSYTQANSNMWAGG
jgi:hypothetical protein